MNRHERRAAKAQARKKPKGDAPHSAPQDHTVEPSDDRAWDDLKTVHLECKTFAMSPTQILVLLRDPQKVQQIPKEKQSQLLEQSQLLAKDFDKYVKWLERIHAKHAHRQGNSTSTDDLMQTLMIGEDYQEWMHSFQLVLLPTVNNISELFATYTDVDLEETPRAVEGELIPATHPSH